MARTDEIGRIGQKRYGGTFYEEFLRELRGKKGIETYREMAENDDTIGAILFAVEMLIRQASWNVEPGGDTPKDKEAAEFVEQCMHDMQDTWTDTISEILSFLTYGWSFHEIVYKRRMGKTRDQKTRSKYNDGLIGWRKLPIRAQETLYQWEYDDEDNLIAMTQLPPPNYGLITIPMDKPIMDAFADEFVFNTHTASVLSWINERGADFITAVTQEQKKAIKAMLTRHVDGTYTVDELSRVIRPCIGLTESQAKANLRYYDSVKAKLLEQHPKMKPENARKKAREAAMKYAEKQHRQRAYDIAQTEMAFAYNKGADEGIRQAQSQNLLGVMEKRWSTSGDSNVCDICRALDGTQIPMDDEFDFKGKILFAGQKRTPPAHPKCACAVLYIEVSPPVFKEGRSG